MRIAFEKDPDFCNLDQMGAIFLGNLGVIVMLKLILRFKKMIPKDPLSDDGVHIFIKILMYKDTYGCLHYITSQGLYRCVFSLMHRKI